MSAPRRVVLGRVGRPHGLQGEVVVREVSLDAEAWERLAQVLLVGPLARPERAVRIAALRPFGPGLLVHFAGVDTVEAAAALAGAAIEVEREALPTPGADEIYLFDLVGLTAVDEAGRELGVVREVFSTGAHELLEIAPSSPEHGSPAIFVPYRPEFVLGWDRDARRLRVRMPSGLEDVYRS